MEIIKRTVGKATVLDVRGPILFGETFRLRRMVDEVVEEFCGEERYVLLNFADVPRICSAGLGQVVRAVTTVRRAGGELKLVYWYDQLPLDLAIKLLTVVGTDKRDEAAVIASFGTYDGC